ncbi:hypothetical protein L3X38_000332 [Prunus dulcis]|uniref:Myb/SANT-like domain-containing protein n=1 Tax=Prunus dulcis TaxID=3755 RepID=A0AAD4YJP2_PRUDU|nr:hypothetical protein L3X38_000332 [Prunus dulcis]
MINKSGFAWNDSLKCIEVDSDEAWNTYVQHNKDADGWRGKQCLIYDRLKNIFGKDQATGRGSATPTEIVTPRTGSAVARYCPLWAWLHSHQPARFCSWELTEQLPRVVTHPGIALASNSFNFGVLTTPKPVSSQKASRYEDARYAI